jgi:hypothetical protein
MCFDVISCLVFARKKQSRFQPLNFQERSLEFPYTLSIDVYKEWLKVDEEGWLVDSYVYVG